MNFVQPIRDKRKLADILSYLKKENKRDHMLVFLGINTGLRIKYILHLKVKDVKGHHISLREFKTKKQKMTRLTPSRHYRVLFSYYVYLLFYHRFFFLKSNSSYGCIPSIYSRITVKASA
ncbi:prophage LambdaBa04, site-specific recombinase, phage integrase family protein (plasmid) [Alkalihalophilus pseudofirmus OF4]|uniref:Prophage LambdaBa04, site-specific recombinase, phage integrase family protein n=1 Tax=Alkalihalophilus pseudofirmus (strain ATCC BAA-2126 / JCM 17055 / OF4) TaxID=398511 RepID=D3G1W5_ALKPO|nr:prophage LambdaBa04, site-specific recombinase, phage integrase family protein [Alkalihalophilus pseudofirmus OF4]